MNPPQFIRAIGVISGWIFLHPRQTDPHLHPQEPAPFTAH